MTTRRSGLALLEAVVAIAIVGFVSVAVLLTLSAQLQASREVGPALIAAEIGRARLMTLRLTPPELLQSLPDSLSAGAEVTRDGEFFWHATVDEVPGQPALVESTIRVTGAGQFVASTYFFRPTRDASTR